LLCASFRRRKELSLSEKKFTPFDPNNLPVPKLRWFCYFDAESDARAFAIHLAEMVQPPGVEELEINSPQPPDPDDPEDEGIPQWSVLFYGDPHVFGGAEAHADAIAEHAEAIAEHADGNEGASIYIAQGWLNGLADMHHGECDGWEAGGNVIMALAEAGLIGPEDMEMVEFEDGEDGELRPGTSWQLQRRNES
jgi:hypothetical protein